MIQVERADSRMLNRGTGPSQWLCPFLHSFLSHAAHPRRVIQKDLPELSVIFPLWLYVIRPISRRILSVELRHLLGQVDPDLPIGFRLAHARNSLFLPANAAIVAPHINGLHLQPAANRQD